MATFAAAKARAGLAISVLLIELAHQLLMFCVQWWPNRIWRVLVQLWIRRTSVPGRRDMFVCFHLLVHDAVVLERCHLLGTRHR